MLTARAFWITRRSAGFECGSEPPALTATLISLLMRANALDMRSQRANIVCLRTSKILPIGRGFSHAAAGKGDIPLFARADALYPRKRDAPLFATGALQ